MEAMDGIEIECRCLNAEHSHHLVEVTGYIDTTTSVHLEAELERQIEEGHLRMLMDLSAVDYVSSAGWGVLVSVIRRVRELGGDLKLVGMQSDVREIFELLEFQSILESYDSIDAALASTMPAS